MKKGTNKMFDDYDTQICPEEFEDRFIDMEDEALYGYNIEYEYEDIECGPVF